MIKRKIKKTSVAIAVTVLLPATLMAQNIGFESGDTSNWSGNGLSAVGVQTVTAGTNTWTISPYGNYMGKLDISSGSFSAMTSGLGLTAGSVTSLQTSPVTNPTTSAWVTKNVTLVAGTPLTLAWQYVSTDYEPYNDGSITTLVKVGDPSVTGSINNTKSLYSLAGFTVTGTGDYSTGSYGSTGWQTATYSVTTSGDYTIGFGVFNLDDTSVSPVLFVDEAVGTTLKNGQSFTPVASNSAPQAPALRAINSATDADTGIGTVTTNVFDGGNLLLNTDSSAAFTFTNNGGSITVDSGTLTASGVLSNEGTDSGTLTKLGSGRLVLSGINTYSGGTTVNAGVLEVSAGANLGTGALTLNGGTLATTASFVSERALVVGANSGTLDVASGTNLTISGVVSGDGALNKTSAGSLILSGANTHTGTLGVIQGTLVLNGSTASAVTNVSAGAMLTGSGSTAGDVVLSGSVSPGNSPGTLSVAGNFSMNAGSSFDSELDGRIYSAAGGAGSYDRIALTGANSVFTAGGQIAPVLRSISAPADNTFTPKVGDAFRVVTTANVNGVDSKGFFSVTDPTVGMPTNTRFDVIYGANHIDLVLTPDNLEVFAQPYGIRNMVNAARAFDGIRPEQGTRSNNDTHNLFNGLYGLGAEPLAKTLLQASGEIHAFALSETREGWQTAANSVGIAAAVKNDRNMWVDASGQNTDYKQDSRASAHETNNTQLWLGTHLLAFNGAQLGVAAGTSKRSVNAMNTSSASVNTESLAIYAVGNKERFDYAAVYSFNQSNINTSRQIGLSTGTVSNSSDSTVNGSVLSLSAGITYELNKQVNGRVWVNGTLNQTKAKSLTEEGSSVTALGVAKESISSSQVTLGYSFSGQIKVPDSRPGTWMLGVGATKLLDQGSHPVTRQMSLHSANWEVSTPNIGDSSQFLQAGVRLPIGANADAWVNLGGTKRQGASGTFGNVGLSIKW